LKQRGEAASERESARGRRLANVVAESEAQQAVAAAWRLIVDSHEPALDETKNCKQQSGTGTALVADLRAKIDASERDCQELDGESQSQSLRERCSAPTTGMSRVEGDRNRVLAELHAQAVAIARRRAAADSHDQREQAPRDQLFEAAVIPDLQGQINAAVRSRVEASERRCKELTAELTEARAECHALQSDLELDHAQVIRLDQLTRQRESQLRDCRALAWRLRSNLERIAPIGEDAESLRRQVARTAELGQITRSRHNGVALRNKTDERDDFMSRLNQKASAADALETQNPELALQLSAMNSELGSVKAQNTELESQGRQFRPRSKDFSGRGRRIRRCVQVPRSSSQKMLRAVGGTRHGGAGGCRGSFLRVPCKYPSTEREIEAIDLEKSNHERKNSENRKRSGFDDY
jgi:hypothetical protein